MNIVGAAYQRFKPSFSFILPQHREAPCKVSRNSHRFMVMCLSCEVYLPSELLLSDVFVFAPS